MSFFYGDIYIEYIHILITIVIRTIVIITIVSKLLLFLCIISNNSSLFLLLFGFKLLSNVCINS